MIRIKGNSLTQMVISLVIVVMLFAAGFQLIARMEQDRKKKEEDIKQINYGEPFFKADVLVPFISSKYKEDSNIDSLKPGLETLLTVLRENNRERIKEFLYPQYTWKNVSTYSEGFIGRFFPLHPDEISHIARDETLKADWYEVKVEGITLRVLVYLSTPDTITAQNVYLDAGYLGMVQDEKGEKVHLAIARELYEIPFEKGYYPMQSSDESAFVNVWDHMSVAPHEAKHIDHMAFFHLLGKLQRGQFDSDQMVRMNPVEYLSRANILRGKPVFFRGTLNGVFRRQLKDSSVPPGMEFYWEGYIINSDMKPAAFRALKIPAEIQEGDIIEIQGYFLQRYLNYNMGKGRFLPMVIAGEVKELEKPSMQISFEKQIILFLILCLLILFALIVMLRHYSTARDILSDRRKPTKKLKPGKGPVNRKIKIIEKVVERPAETSVAEASEDSTGSSEEDAETESRQDADTKVTLPPPPLVEQQSEAKEEFPEAPPSPFEGESPDPFASPYSREAEKNLNMGQSSESPSSEEIDSQGSENQDEPKQS